MTFEELLPLVEEAVRTCLADRSIRSKEALDRHWPMPCAPAAAGKAGAVGCAVYVRPTGPADGRRRGSVFFAAALRILISGGVWSTTRGESGFHLLFCLDGSGTRSLSGWGAGTGAEVPSLLRSVYCSGLCRLAGQLPKTGTAALEQLGRRADACTGRGQDPVSPCRGAGCADRERRGGRTAVAAGPP